MEFSFSEDQIAVRELATGLFRDFGSDENLQKFWTADAAYDNALWLQLQQTGLTALCVDETAGGSGMGMIELMLVLEQQGRALAPAPLWRHQVATAALAAFADPSLLAVPLAELVDGNELVTLGMEGLHDHRGIGLRAERTATGWVLQGRAVAVPQAQSAHLVLLPAQTDSGLRLFAIDPRGAGIDLLPGRLTHHEPAADLLFANATLASHAMLAEPALEWLQPRAIACVCALQLGVADEALRRAVTYIGERQQFGRPLATFQALSQKVADCYIDIEALRSTLWQLCWRLDAGLDAGVAAAVAKSWAADCGHRVSHAAQHMHGGIGVDISYPIHRFTLWSRALESSLGGAAAQLESLGRQLAANVFGERS